jgi:hypothetical protein
MQHVGAKSRIAGHIMKQSTGLCCLQLEVVGRRLHRRNLHFQEQAASG